MTGKMATSAPSAAIQLPGAPVAVHASRLSCREAGKAQMFTPVWDSPKEPRINGIKFPISRSMDGHDRQ